MPSILVKTAAGILHHDVEALCKQIQEGDGMGWPGDPRMYIRIGVVTLGGRTGRRYEVWRLNEDGSDTFCASWRIEERDRIIFDLARMRPEAPGFVSAHEQITENNDRLQKESADQYHEAAGEMMSHLASIASERGDGKNTFRQVGGLRDEPKPATKKLIVPGKD